MRAQATPRPQLPATGHNQSKRPKSVADKPARKADRRVEKTKSALLEAFFALMIEKGYEECGVADIVERANVGRSTFYAHYADKQDLLQDGLRGLKEHLLDASTKRADSNVHPVLLFSLPMLEHLLDARELFRALATKGTGSAVHRELHSMLTELIVERLDTSGGVPTAPASLVAEFVVGAFLAICFWWLSGRDELSPQEVDRMFQALAMPGLRTNAGWASSGVPSGP